MGFHGRRRPRRAHRDRLAGRAALRVALALAGGSQRADAEVRGLGGRCRRVRRRIRCERSPRPPRRTALTGRPSSRATSRRSSSSRRRVHRLADVTRAHSAHLARRRRRQPICSSPRGALAKATGHRRVGRLQHRRRVRRAGQSGCGRSREVGRQAHVHRRRRAARTSARARSSTTRSSRTRRTCSARTTASTRGQSRSHAQYVLVLRGGDVQQQGDAAFRAADRRRHAAGPQPRLRLGARAAERRAAGRHAVRRMARRADSQRHVRRSRSIIPRATSRSTARARSRATLFDRRTSYVSGHFTRRCLEPGRHRRRLERRRACHPRARAALLRSARRAVRRRRAVQQSRRLGLLLAPRQHRCR